jgi:ribonuclease HI
MAAAEEVEELKIYTDGACSDNGGKEARAGVGVFIGKDDPRNISEPLDMPPHTNNRAELRAIWKALQIIEKHKPKKATVFTDSKYCISSLTVWILKWKKNGWKGSNKKPVLNRDMIEPMEMMLNELKKSIDITLQYVAAHTGIVNNEAADQLAREGAAQSTSVKKQRVM